MLAVYELAERRNYGVSVYILIRKCDVIECLLHLVDSG